MSDASETNHEPADRRLPNSNWSHETSRLESGLELSVAQIDAQAGEQWESASTPGVTICGIVRGGLEFNLDQRGFEQASPPMMFILNGDEPVATRHRMHRDQQLTAITVHLSDDFVEQLRVVDGNKTNDLPDLFDVRGSQPKLRAWVADRALSTVLRRMAACPFEGVTRQLYLQGTALELVGFVANEMGPPRVRRVEHRLSLANTERVLAARDILIAEFNAPPSLDELARRVGMSASALTAGFRAKFDTSIAAFCQQYRLDRAYRNLESGQSTVAQAAFEVGYSPAYFSTLFRRKFGFSPSEIGSRRG